MISLQQGGMNEERSDSMIGSREGDRVDSARAQTSKRRADFRQWAAFACGLVGIGGALSTIYASPAAKAPVLSCGVEMLACDVALSAPVSQIGGIPLGVFGVFYFVFWMLSLRGLQRTKKDEYRTALTWGTTAGVAVSMTLATYMFGVLGAPCLYCLITHAANLSAFALMWPWLRWRAPNLGVSEVRHFAAVAAVALLAASTIYFANENRHAQAQLAVGAEEEVALFDASLPDEPYASALSPIGYEEMPDPTSAHDVTADPFAPY